MDREVFCDKHCPIPTIYYNVVDGKDSYAECDLEDSDCPFKDVDFSKVIERVGK